ncbi:MAG: aspartate aminotransferase family protein [Sulfobacillus sp.]
MSGERSRALFDRALQVVPGGVMSPARSFGSVGLAAPVFLDRAEGAWVWDADGNRYIDYLGAFGPHILGHGDRRLTAALVTQVQHGILFGTPHQGEVLLAEKLVAAVPCLDQVRLVSSGTEALMSVVRLARAATGRDLVLKFDGHYHGHFDGALVAAGSGASQTADGGSSGIPAPIRQRTLSVPFNDLTAARRAVASHAQELALILVEPICGNMGVVWPHQGYLQGLRTLADEAGCLLAYDEVIVGFRARFGPAYPLVGPAPDLIAFGKVLGGGLPLGAYGGRRDLMQLVTPLGAMFQAGTHAGNPLSVTAALTVLQILAEDGVYQRLEEGAKQLADGLLAAGLRHGWPVSLSRLGSTWTLFFTAQAPSELVGAQSQDRALFARFFAGMLTAGVLLAPSFYESWFWTLAHGEAECERTLQAAEQVFAAG